MDFKNANELLDLCKKHDLPISEVMRQREIVEGEKEADTVHDAMARVLEIMKNAAFTPIKEPVRSMGGLIGGEAKKIASRYHSGFGICGDLLEKSMIYAMATLETNASMGLIVASPTAGSAGIVPGLLLGLQEVHKLDDEQIIQCQCDRISCYEKCNGCRCCRRMSGGSRCCFCDGCFCHCRTAWR